MKLNHENFKWEMQFHTSLGGNHFNPSAALGRMHGYYILFESLGFRKVEIDRIVLEHLPPKYDIYLIKDGAAPCTVTLNAFTIVADYYGKQTSEDSPFHTLSEKRIRDLYSNPRHSDEFWSEYRVKWLPEREAFLKQYFESRKSFWRRMFH